MPYENGVRITQAEYIALKHEREGKEDQFFATGPNGDAPAAAPDIDPEVGGPKSKSKKAGTKRSARSKATVNAAVANALGVAEDSPVLADIDSSSLDSEPEADSADAS